jgi:signal peptidase
LESLRTPFKYLSYLAFAFVAGVLLLLAVATAPVLFGYHTYVIDGGSMEPTLSNGSVAVTHPTSPRAIGVGDIIAYRSSPQSAPVLHRVTAVEEDADGNRLFTTQGDANGTADPIPVPLAGSGDKMVYSVPYAGYVLGFAGTAAGRLAFIGVPVVLLVAGFVWEKLRAVPFRRSGASETERQKLLAMLVPPASDAPIVLEPQQAPPPEPLPMPIDVAVAEDRSLPAFLLRQLAEIAPAAGARSDDEHEPLAA